MSRREVVMICYDYSEIYWTLGIIYIEAYMGLLYHDIHLHYWMAWKQADVFSPSLGDLDRPSCELELPYPTHAIDKS